jgi:hypothetical protein
LYLAAVPKQYRISLTSPIFRVKTKVREVSMFDSLADRIRQDEHNEVTNNERMVRWLAIAVISVLLFGGLYFGIRMLEG